MTNVEYRKSICEVLDILKHTRKEDVDKISPKFMDFLNKNKDDNYIPNLDHTKRIKEMNLSDTTIGILSIINSKFWCNDEQRQEFNKKLNENEIKYQKELREKYNPDNVFQNKTIKNTNENETQENLKLVKHEEPKWYKKIMNKILSLLKK